MMKKMAHIVIGVALAGSLVVACGKYIPPILAGIDCNDPQKCGPASRDFSDRLHAKYPPGSNQDVLDRDLTAQGFKRRYPGLTHCRKPHQVDRVGTAGVDCIAHDVNWNPQHALWYWNCGSGPFCDRYAIVVWSSDAMGRITYLAAGYVNTRGAS